jgi:hypothetical protein
MVMDSKTLTALKSSIEHWRENEAALSTDDASTSCRSCALCHMFQTDRIETCKACPVAEATGSVFCDCSPYEEASEAYHDWEDVEDWGMWDDGSWPFFASHKFIEHWRAREEFLLAARDERQFLESLLP